MMKQLSLAVCLTLLPLLCGAQILNASGRTLEELLPDPACEHYWSEGDLNKDGIRDLALLATTAECSTIEVDEEGDTLRMSQPVFAVYFGTPEGYYNRWREYPEMMPISDNYISNDISLEITDRGVLRISVETFASMGGWSSYDDTYTYRFQDGDFFLIGRDSRELARNTGKMVTTSYNFITRKKQTITDNAFEEDFKPTEKWEKLPAEPLQRMGEPLG